MATHRRILLALIIFALAITACQVRSGGLATTGAADRPPQTAPSLPPSPVTPLPPADQLPLNQQVSSLALVARAPLGPRSSTANVTVLGQTGFVGSFGRAACDGLGVRIVDLSDPANPTLLATTTGSTGATAENAIPARVATPAFSGDLLAVGLQRCNQASGARGGLLLVDVTDPANPIELGFLDTGTNSRGVHELDVVVQGNRVLALLAVPRSSRSDEGEVRIVDITDPRQPVQVGLWDVRTDLGITEGSGCERSVYAHSVSASRDGTRAFVSNWDAGAIVLDIQNPAQPRAIGRIAESGIDGSIHSVADLGSGLVVLTEESFYRAMSLRARSGGQEWELAGCEGESGQTLSRVGVVSGDLVPVGTACEPVERRQGAVALVELAECGLDLVTRNLRAAGYRAALVPMDGAPRTIYQDEPDSVLLPIVTIGSAEANRLRSAIDSNAVQIELPSGRAWGGAYLWDSANPGNPTKRATIRTPNSVLFPPPTRSWYTAHNPLAFDRYLAIAWYADGLRLFDISNPDLPREVASYAPSGSFAWGVAKMGDYLLVSDITSGLIVLRIS